MEDIFHDEKFERFLYGGVRDLDEDIGRLIYKIYNRAGVKTSWSCSGHIARFLPDVGNTSRKGYFIYQTGHLQFRADANEKDSTKFMKELSELLNQNNFASLSEDKNEYCLLLDMADLVEPDNSGIKLPYGFRRDKEVREDLAIKRYNLFKKFWKNLDDAI